VIGLDTNILVRYLVADDPVQSARARHILEEQLSSAEPGYISLVAMAETVWVLDNTYGIGRRAIARTVERLLAADNLRIQNEHEVFAAKVMLESGVASFSDALIGELGISAGCSQTLTFDLKAARMGTFKLA
jgi:predicted nucleic-acid-binding protein